MGSSQHDNSNKSKTVEDHSQACSVPEPPLMAAIDLRIATSKQRQPDDSSVRINFKIRKDGTRKNQLVLAVD
jgi:hypothetical protein